MRYHWLSVISTLSVVPFANLATAPPPLWGDIRDMHRWETVPANWESLGPPPPDTTLNLNIALKPDRDDALIEALHEVSNPDHERYRVYLSREQIAELVAPSQDTLELVHSWLQHHGVPSSSISTSHGGGWLKITGVPVSQADKLLSASYQLYRHIEAKTTEVVLRTISYKLPEVLHGHVQTVSPTTYFDTPRKKLLSTPLERPSEKGAGVVWNATSRDLVRVLPRIGSPRVTPAFLSWLYGTQGYVPVAMGYNALGVLELNNENASYTDLALFMTNFRADAVAATFTVDYVNGGLFDPNNPSTEASLNIQYGVAMTYPTPNILYTAGGLLHGSSAGPAPDDPYLVWLNYLLVQEYIPPTISISWGNPEYHFPPAYASSLCTLFARLGLRGVSVLIASGDDGVGPGDCRDYAGNVYFVPEFPASCTGGPWVTSVGGTTGFNPEVAMYMSGGGFSHLFPRPPYQSVAVPPFVESLGTVYAGLYNPFGRGIPDVSAQSYLFKYFLRGSLSLVSGTSAAAPTVAGIVSLLNDYLLSTDRGRLGFLNPLLYSYLRPGLIDITLGSNPGCGTYGFSAVPGWDPVTGLGTPNFQVLRFILDLTIPARA